MIDVSFERNPAQQLLASLNKGQSLSALDILTALDNENEEAVEELLEQLRALDIKPDLDTIPVLGADSEQAVRLRREEQLVKQNMLMQQLEKSDPLYLYLDEIASLPVCGDENILAKKLLEDPENEDVKAQLLNLNLGRIVTIAEDHVGRGMLLLDLIQEGSLGLWERLSDYVGGDFSEFADHWIRWYMAKAVILQAHASGVGQKMRQMVEDYRSVDERLLAELGRNPTLEEIAEGLHISVPEATAVAQALQNARLLQNAKKPEPEQLPEEEDQAVEDTAYFQMRQRIEELLSGLPEQEVQLLTLRYGLEGGLPMSPEQVGTKLGLTPEEVIAKEAAALSKMRQRNE